MISIGFIYIVKKLRVSKRVKISFSILYLLLLYVFLVLPFQRGKEINEMIVSGFKVVDAVKKYEATNNILPQTLNVLNENGYLDEREVLNSEITWQYEIIDHKKKNENDKHHPNYRPLGKDVFNLSMWKEFLGLEKLRYDRDKNIFELYDDV